MTVNIIISDASASDSLADTVDLGTVTPGSDSTVQDLFIRHDATVNPITDCAWYLQRYVGSGYLGVDADADFAEIMAWGDANPTPAGGFMINQVIPGAWAIDDEFADVNLQVFANGNGDINNQLPLLVDSINIGTPVVAGQIPLSGEAHVQVKFKVPTSVSAGAGYRAATLVFAYSATS